MRLVEKLKALLAQQCQQSPAIPLARDRRQGACLLFEQFHLLALKTRVGVAPQVVWIAPQLGVDRPARLVPPHRGFDVTDPLGDCGDDVR